MKAYTTKEIDTMISLYESGHKTELRKIVTNNVIGYRKPYIAMVLTYKELDEYSKCIKDPVYFIETYCKIMTPNGLQNIKLRKYQLKVIQNYLENRMNIVMASRQSGMTTIISLLTVYELLFNVNLSIGIIGCKFMTSAEAIEKIRNIYQNIPYFLKPGIVSYNQKQVTFDNGSSVSATNEINGRGKTFDTVFIQDFAHFPRNVLNNIMPTVSTQDTSRLFIYSPPNGYNHFYDLFNAAERGKNLYVPERIYWWDVEERDDNWRDAVIRNLGSRELFMQEYELSFSPKKGEF